MNPLCYLLPVAAYFYGAIPYGYLMAKALKGVDIRRTGSGSIGATNAARVLGLKFFPVVFLLDFSKGFLAALAGKHLAPAGGFEPHPLAVAAAVAAILGHVFSIYLRFKGGKAVAAGAGALTILAPGALLVGFIAWVAAFAIWRYVSLASICAAAGLAAAVWLVCSDPLGSGAYRTAFGTLAALFVVYLHRSNIRRLLAGAEHKAGGRSNQEAGRPET